MKPDFIKINLAKLIFFLCSIFMIVLIWSVQGEAHRVNLFAWVEGDTIHVESKFSGGKRVNAGNITVLDSDGGELLSGMTNENGEFSFKIPKKTDLKIVIDTGEGHRAEWSISAADIEMPAAEKKPAMEQGLPAKNILIGVGCIFALAAIVALTRKRKMKS
jgi:nickel transport protein